jgi:hypothetical protein
VGGLGGLGCFCKLGEDGSTMINLDTLFQVDLVQFLARS